MVASYGEKLEACPDAVNMNISDYICALFINLFILLGVWTIFRPGMIFGAVGDIISKKAPEWVTMPTINCPKCMSSVQGTAFFWLSSIHVHLPWWTWPFHVLALCGLTTIVMMFDHE